MKFYGAIGFATTKETTPGVWEEVITEQSYYGDVTRNTRKLQNSEGLNDDINIGNDISIVANPYVMSNIYAMRYIVFQGAKWKISNVDVQYPRLILSIGGLYNDGEET